MNHRLMILMVLGLFSFQSCSAQSKVNSKSYNLMLKALLSHSVPEIDASTAHEKLTSDAIFLDAREQKEYEVSHIENAIHVGYDSLDLSKVETLAKSRPVVVYCSVGYRSEKVSEQLLKQGFTDVFNLYGGIFEWKNQGYEVVNESGITNEVHAFDKVWGVWLKKGKKVY